MLTADKRPTQRYEQVVTEIDHCSDAEEQPVDLDTNHNITHLPSPLPLVENEDLFSTAPNLKSHNDNDLEYISTDVALERIGMGAFQIRILIASGLCFAADAMQVILLSFLSLVVQDLWSLSNDLTAMITSSLFAGSMLGTLILGPLADSWGRRPVFMLASSIISFFGFATSAATNYGMLTATIFGVGVGVGGLTVPFDILAEFLPSSQRGTNLLKIEYFWTIGCLFVVGIAYMTLRGEVPHWRLFVATCSVPCLVSLVLGYCWVPESAQWLCAEGRTDEALEILRHAAALNGLEKDEVFPSNTKLLQDEDEKDASLADLFTPKWRETTLRLWGAWGSFAFGYYGTLLAITKVFAEAETINRVAVGDEEPYSFDYGAIFASSTAELVGTTMVIFAVDRIGRIPSQVFSYLIAGLSVCALCVFASWGFPRYALIGLSFIARVFEMAATCVTWVSTAEILTTEVRSTGHSTANAMARLGAIFCPYLVQGSASLTQIGVVMLLVHFFTAFCVSKLPETKGKGMGTVSEDQPVDSAINRLNLLPLETNDYNEDNLVIQGELS